MGFIGDWLFGVGANNLAKARSLIDLPRFFWRDQGSGRPKLATSPFLLGFGELGVGSCIF